MVFSRVDLGERVPKVNESVFTLQGDCCLLSQTDVPGMVADAFADDLFGDLRTKMAGNSDSIVLGAGQVTSSLLGLI